jgi:organic hydroperoxide reductase OsmC/OhrA
VEYAIELADDGSLRAEDGTVLDTPHAWSPEHLLLAGLVRCSLKSLRHHAKRAGIEIETATGSASARVTKRESDGRYAIADTEVTLDVQLVPLPNDPSELLAKAERDCFVGSSLTAKPHYSWTVY